MNFNGELPFSTDYWGGFPPGMDEFGSTAQVTGQSPNQGNPALPAMAWLGILIALIAIRVLSDMG